MEKDLGIEEYVGEIQQPIPCVLKELYTDFIVQEIGENQFVLPIQPPELNGKEGKAEVNIIQQSDVVAPECISEQAVTELNDFVNNIKTKGNNSFSIYVKDLSKEERTLIHKYIRERYNGSLNSEHKNDSIIVTTGNSRNDRKRKRWDKDTPDYLHFTLAKENKDTSYALGILAKFIGVKSDQFRFCGIKDKRAVTSQRVSCYRVEKDKITNVVSKLRGFTLFDFEYKPEGLKMGGHWGNRFSIILRNVPSDSKEEILSRCAIFKEKGFLNYFGTQRFGSSIDNTAQTGKLILQRKWEEAIKNIFRTAEEMGKTTVAEAASHFRKTGNAKEALKKLKGGQQFASIESNILQALSRGKTWQQCLTEVIPINMRSLYVHAYQSLLWNKIASRRIREYGCAVMAADVTQTGECVTDEDIFSVCIALPGSKDDLFPEYAKKWLEELLNVDQLTHESFRSLRDRFALGDSTRSLLVKPGDVEYDIITYKNNRQTLQEGLLKRENYQKEEENNDNEFLALKVQFNLPNGAYATCALRQITGFDMGKTNMVEMGKQDEENVAVGGAEADTTNTADL